MVSILKKCRTRNKEEVKQKLVELQKRWEETMGKEENILKRDVLSKLDGEITALRWILKEIEDL